MVESKGDEIGQPSTVTTVGRLSDIHKGSEMPRRRQSPGAED